MGLIQRQAQQENPPGRIGVSVRGTQVYIEQQEGGGGPKPTTVWSLVEPEVADRIADALRAGAVEARMNRVVGAGPRAS
jgi:hypothetical protein